MGFMVVDDIRVGIGECGLGGTIDSDGGWVSKKQIGGKGGSEQ